MVGIIVIAIIVYVVGGIVSTYIVLPLRAGAPVELRGLRGEHIALNRNNVEWLLVKAAKSIAWPGVLTYWLSQGRPPSPWKVVRKIKVDDRVVMLVRRASEKTGSETDVS